jgi:hypothetical protein
MDSAKINGLTVFTIATNKYWEYFLHLLPNLRDSVNPDFDIQVIVLTNKYPEGEYPTHLKNLKVLVRQSEYQDWPEVTLLRYGQILKHANLIKFDRFLWIDVDMKFQKEFNPGIFCSGVYLARHPGYIFSRSGFMKLSAGEKWDFIRERVRLAQKIQFSRGAWEDNPISTANVAPPKRKSYVHGAVWGGLTTSVLHMSEVLNTRICQDLTVPFVAKWHDESHLNWYHANYPQELLPRHFSGVLNHWTSEPSKSTVISLNKETLDLELGIES